MRSLALHSVSLERRRSRILSDISVEFGGGEIALLKGPNGAGKTQLLRTIAGLQSPSSGRIYCRGGEGSAVDLCRSQVGWVGHEFMLYSHLSARRNLEFFSRLYGLQLTSRRANKLLTAVGLSDLDERPVSHFSEGMKQRLSVARGIVHKPELILLDEPWSSIDESGSVELRDLFEELSSPERIIIIATHLANTDFADRVVSLERGRVQKSSPV